MRLTAISPHPVNTGDCLFLFSGYKIAFLSEFVLFFTPLHCLLYSYHNVEERANAHFSQAICELERWQTRGQRRQQTRYPPENILPGSVTTGPVFIREHHGGQSLQIPPAVTVPDHKFILLKTLFPKSIFSLASSLKNSWVSSKEKAWAPPGTRMRPHCHHENSGPNLRSTLNNS